FRIDRAAVFRAFALQQLERMAPDRVGLIAQGEDCLCGKPIAAKSLAPLADQAFGARAHDCEAPQWAARGYMDDRQLIKPGGGAIRKREQRSIARRASCRT